MKDITFNELKNLVASTPLHIIEDMGFADETAFFQAASDRVSYLRDFFLEVTYTKRDGHTTYFKFDPIEIAVNEEELIKIRDNIYDRGGDPNRIVLGIYELFEKPNYGVPSHQSRTEYMLASFFVKS